MDNTLKRAIELCLAVYRITDRFPSGEVLETRLRALAVDIIECLVYSKALPTDSGRIFNLEGFARKIRVLFSYFAVAEKQGWVGEKNFVLLKDEYRRLYIETANKSQTSAAKQENTDGTKRQALHFGGQASLPARQEKILGFLKGKIEGEAISDIAKIIGASNKTAERDLKKLISAGRVEKQGNTKGARFLFIIDK